MIVARGWTGVVSFATFIAIGRTLAPAEFGIFALASAIALLPHGLVGAGLYERAMWKDDGPSGRDTLFWASVATGAASALVTVLFAFIAQIVFPDPRLSHLLYALALMPAMQGAAAVLEAQTLRRDHGGRLAAVLGLAETAGFATLCAALYLNQGVFSLVWSRLVNQAFTTGGMIIVQDALPRFSIDWKLLRELRGLIGDMLGARVINWADGYSGDMILAAVLSTAGVGIYRMGARLFATVASVLISAPGQVQTANASKAAARGPHGVETVIARTIRLHLAIALPVIAGFAALVSDVVRLLLAPEWAGAGNVAVLLALAAPVMIVSQGLGASLIVLRRSRMLVYVQIGGAVSATAGLLLAAAGGPEAAALAKTLVSAGFICLAFYYVRSLAAARALSVLGTMAALTVAATIMGAIIWSASALLRDGAPWLHVLGVLAASIVGFAAYVGAARMLAPRTSRFLRGALARALRRMRKARPQPAQLGQTS